MNTFENENCKIWIDNGVCHIITLAKHVTKDIVENIIKHRLELIDGNKYLMLSDISRVKVIDREARQRFSQKDGAIGTIAVGIIVSSKLQVIMYNFFNSIYKAPTPAKLFTDTNEALKWLEKFKK
ncbi:MAG: hypothetical protein WCK02_05920 [Bacteroidota bacterium]